MSEKATEGGPNSELSAIYVEDKIAFQVIVIVAIWNVSHLMEHLSLSSL